MIGRFQTLSGDLLTMGLKREKLTQARLKELFYYNPEVGFLVRRISCGNNTKIGDIAGYENPSGYRIIVIGYRGYYAHCLIFLWMEGYFPENEIDHIDKNKSNNKFDNLRIVSRQCNSRNCGNPKNNTSGVKGIYFNKQIKKWQAYIIISRKNYHLGYYSDFNNAVCARLAGEQCVDWEGCDSSSPAYQYVQKILKSAKGYL